MVMDANAWSVMSQELAKASPFGLFALLSIIVVCVFFRYSMKKLVEQHNNSIEKIASSYEKAYSFLQIKYTMVDH